MELLLVPTTSLCACANDEVSSYLDKDGLIARRDELINEILATRMARMHSEMYRSDHIRDAVTRNRDGYQRGVSSHDSSALYSLVHEAWGAVPVANVCTK